MRTLQINAKAQGSTHGRATAFVVDPRGLTLTHLAVRTPGALPSVHLIRFGNVIQSRGGLRSTDAVDATPDDRICYVPLGGWPHPEGTHEVGIVHVVGWPRVRGGRRPQWTTDDLDLVVDYDWIPKGLVELGVHSDVFDQEHRVIGHPRAVIVEDQSGRLIELEIHRSSLWPRADVVVPVDNDTAVDYVLLNVSRGALCRAEGRDLAPCVAS